MSQKSSEGNPLRQAGKHRVSEDANVKAGPNNAASRPDLFKEFKELDANTIISQLFPRAGSDLCENSKEEFALAEAQI